MAQKKITKTLVAEITRGDAKTLVVHDTEVKGFQLHVGERAKTFSFMGYLNKKLTRITIGRSDQFTADEAREKAIDFRRCFKRGVDPRYKPGKTFKDALEAAIAQRMGDDGMLQTTAEEYRRTTRNHCAKWLDRDLALITKAEVEKKKHELAKVGQKSTANGVVNAIGIARRALDLPKFEIKRYTLEPRTSKVSDWAIWYQEIMEFKNPTKRNCLLFIALTGLRRDNGRKLTWAQIDWEKETIYIPKTKTTTNQTFPLSKAAVAILKNQLALREESSPYVFPWANYTKKGAIVELRSSARVHDLRRLYEEVAEELLLPDYMIAKLRGDVPAKARHAYNQRHAPHEIQERVTAGILVRLGISPQ